MAQECGAVIGAIDLLKGRHLYSSTIYQLYNARNQLECVSVFLAKLEEVFPENTISTQLGALFQQAHDGFSEICTHMDQRYTIKMTKALKIIKLNNIAERLEAASKPSLSTREMISEVLKILKPENIAQRIKASKPSTSSSRITTMEMVRFVDFLLDYVKDCAPVKLRYLHAFFILTSSRCIEHESMQYLFSHVEDVAYTALQQYFLQVANKINSKIELHKLVSPFKTDLMQIYISLLTASKSSRSDFEVIDSYLFSSSCHDNMDLVMMGFHEYIIDNLLLKDETDLSFTVGDDVKKFYYGLLLLVTSLIDPLAQCTGFAIEAESVNSNKSNLVLQFLTVAFKLIESETRLIYVLEYSLHEATLEAHEELIYLRVLLIYVLRQHT